MDNQELQAIQEEKEAAHSKGWQESQQAFDEWYHKYGNTWVRVYIPADTKDEVLLDEIKRIVKQDKSQKGQPFAFVTRTVPTAVSHWNRDRRCVVVRIDFAAENRAWAERKSQQLKLAMG